MSTRYSSAAGAAVLLIAALWGSTALAEGHVASTEVCTSGKNVVIRYGAHPGKSTPMPRRESQGLARCSASPARSLMLVSFIDAPGGTSLTSGRTDRAIHQITRQDPDANDALALNNLCVAHTVQRQWANARSSCDAAVAATSSQRSKVEGQSVERRRLANKVAAAAYSNRAVMSWLANDALAAQGDFARAQAMAPKADFVVRNAELAMRLPARVEYAHLPVG